MKFKKGDIVVSAKFPDIERKILEVHKSNYVWRYTDVEDREFDSANSNDPQLEYWTKKEIE